MQLHEDYPERRHLIPIMNEDSVIKPSQVLFDTGATNTLERSKSPLCYFLSLIVRIVDDAYNIRG